MVEKSISTICCLDIDLRYHHELNLTWGYNDNTCPPTTSYAVWNTLKCEKESLLTPINEHWTTTDTNRNQMEWIKKHLIK